MRYMALYGTLEHRPCSDTESRLRRYRSALRRCAQRSRREFQARTAAEAAMDEKDRALAAICHDLRAPLNAINGWAQLARAESVADSVAMQEALSQIEANVQMQAMLINDILDVARSANGILDIEREPVDLNSVVAAALQIVEPVADAKQVQIKFDAAPAPPVVLGDSTRLQRVVWNLLTNGIEFTPGGGHVCVEVVAADRNVLLRVSDTGAGIDQELLPRVFERFHQGERKAATIGSGAGLGLAIVRRLVELHGGDVKAESAGKGLGATFTVSLPSAALGSRSETHDEQAGDDRELHGGWTYATAR